MPIEFPLSGLDLPALAGQDSALSDVRWLYDLRAFVVHEGPYGAGHYVACGLDEKSGEWFLYDDARVSACSLAEVRHAPVCVASRRTPAACRNPSRARPGRSWSEANLRTSTSTPAVVWADQLGR